MTIGDGTNLGPLRRGSLPYAIDYRRGPVEDRMSGDEYPPEQQVRTHVFNAQHEHYGLVKRVMELERIVEENERQLLRITRILMLVKPTDADIQWACEQWASICKSRGP